MSDQTSFAPTFPAAPPSRALVLGGGGSTGNAWLIGVLAGLAEAGIDVTGADLVVGTSAGATAAAQLSGAAPTDLLASVLSARHTARPGGTPTTPVTDHLDRLRALIASASGPDDLRRRISAAALERDAATDGSWSAQWRTAVAARLPQQDWPERAVVLTAVYARTGQAVLLDRHSDIDLADAVAASCASALPYRLGDRRLLDGAYRRGENADIAAGHDRVLVLSPLSGRSLHPRAWRSHLAAQVEELQAAGDGSRPSCRTTRPSPCSARKAWTCPCVRPPPAPGTRRAWPTLTGSATCGTEGAPKRKTQPSRPPPGQRSLSRYRSATGSRPPVLGQRGGGPGRFRKCPLNTSSRTSVGAVTPIGEEQQRALQDALIAVGAPVEQAADLASRATLEDDDGSLMLCLEGHCCQVDDGRDVSASEALADNAAADNAEAHDRQERGEAGYSPWWPLPGRQPRR